MTPGRALEQCRALSHAERIAALVDIQRRRATLDAEEQLLLAVIDADPAADPDRREFVLAKGFVREEVACALRIAFGTAQSRLHTARMLVEKFADTLEALDAGTVTYLHCRCLVEQTKDLDADLASHVEARVLPAAGSQTVGEFRRAVVKAILALDPADSSERHQRAAADRRVECFPGEDGMATVWALLPAPDAQALMTCLDAIAGRATDERSMDQRRADALTTLALDAVDRLPTQHGRRPAVQVTVALSTLLDLDQQPGELAGYGPICAELARELAFDTTGTWRRLVTDQHGHLLELGTSSYRPPQQLADVVIARDQTCRIPGCTRRAGSCDLDHVIPWPGGPTDADNLHPLCRRHHHLKHEAGWHVSRAPDGSTKWITPTGRRYEKPPAAYPIDHTGAEPMQPSAADPAWGLTARGLASPRCRSLLPT